MPRGRENVYSCAECGAHTTTLDVDEGTTPFAIGCPECGGDAYSNWYPEGPRPAHIPPPSYEWYRPGWWERLWLGKAAKEHVRLGGLRMRPLQ